MAKKKSGRTGRPRKFRNLVSFRDDDYEEEENEHENEEETREYVSREKQRSREFMSVFHNLYGEVPETHPDYTEYKNKTIGINATTMAYFDLLQRMRRMGMFCEIPREVVAQMESEIKGMTIYNTRDGDDLTYSMMVHISVRFLAWWLMGNNRHTAMMMRYMTKLSGEKIRLKASKLSLDRGYVLEQEVLKTMGYVDDDEEMEEILQEIEEAPGEDFDFDGIEDLF